VIELVNRINFPQLRRYKWSLSLLVSFSGVWLVWPQVFYDTLYFVFFGMVEVAPLVIPGILISAWVSASGAGDRIRRVFEGNRLKAILLASTVGAVTPVCGVTVLPLMAGLLSSGVPLAPIMAFWLSSPVTDPAMFAVTMATLGLNFAVAKTLAALIIGFAGGLLTASMGRFSWTQQVLRERSLFIDIGSQSCSLPGGFELAFWRDRQRTRQFVDELKSMTRLILICLGLAFAAEYLMQENLPTEAFAAYVGNDAWWAVPVAVLVGSPAYLDGYAALPLTRGLIDHGMSLGAAMAFLVSGSVVSIWGAIAIFPVLKLKPFMLYLGLAISGSMLVGWLYQLIV